MNKKPLLIALILFVSVFLLINCSGVKCNQVVNGSFGYTTAGANGYFYLTGTYFQYLGGINVSEGQYAYLNSITAYLKCTSAGTFNYSFALYNVTAGSQYGYLIAQTQTLTSAFTTNQVGWFTLVFANPPLLTNGTFYNLVEWSNGTASYLEIMGTTSATGYVLVSNTTYSNTAYANFPSSVLWANTTSVELSIYGNYTTTLTNPITSQIERIFSGFAGNIIEITTALMKVVNVPISAVVSIITTGVKNTIAFITTYLNYQAIYNIIAQAFTFISQYPQIIISKAVTYLVQISNIIYQAITRINGYSPTTPPNQPSYLIPLDYLIAVIIMIIPTWVFRDFLGEVATIPAFDLMAVICFFAGLIPLAVLVLIALITVGIMFRSRW